MNPKKSFGQNFLTSLPAKEAILSAGRLSENDTILEIGPGKGFLTQGILESGATLYAVEKDRDLLPLLRESFASYIDSQHFILEEGDALTYEPPFASYKLIANIPYYITGAIIERFLSHERKPRLMVILIQKEVAERIVARDGKESILSLAVKAYGTPKIVHKVSAGSFFPKPKVDSAVLLIDNISSARFQNEDEELLFFTVMKQGFAHKRKKLSSNLKELFDTKLVALAFQKANLSDTVRAEDVTLETWCTLSSTLANSSSHL